MGLLRLLGLVPPPPVPEPEPHWTEKLWLFVQEQHLVEYMVLLAALFIGAKLILGNNDSKTSKEKDMEQMLEDMASKIRAQEEKILAQENEIKRLRKGDPASHKSRNGEQQVRFSEENDKTQSEKPKGVFKRVSTRNRRRASLESQVVIDETSMDPASEVLAAHAERRILKRDIERAPKEVLAQTVNERLQQAKTTNFAHADAISKRSSKSKQDKKDILATMETWEQTKNLTLLDQINLVDHFDEIEYPKGAVIIKEGNLADYAYIIKSGKVNKHSKNNHAKEPKTDPAADATSTSSGKKSNFFKKMKNRGKSDSSEVVDIAAQKDPQWGDSNALMDDISSHESDSIDNQIIATKNIEETYGPCMQTLGAGDPFGGVALAFSYQRNNTFIALMPCKVWRISRQEYHRATKAMPEANKKPRMSMVEDLRKIKEFSLFEDDVLEEIAKNFITKKFKGGERIIKKYDVGDAFYIVKKGSVKITNIGLGDARINTVKGLPGFWFGEGALLTGDKRAADVHAGDEGVEVLEMTRSVFESKLGPFDQMFEKAKLRRHMIAMPTFCNSNLTEKELSALADAFEEKVFEAKHIIARPNHKTPSAIYIVNYGEVFIADEKSNAVNRMVGNGHFGTRTIHRATGDTYISERTIKAEIETKCWVLSRAAILKVIGSMSRLSEAKSFLSENLDRTIRLDNIERMNLFGKGSFGRVWFAKHKTTRAVYALKSMSKAELAKYRETVIMVKREKNLMASVSHPLIGKLIATVQDPENLYMLMKFYSGGELSSIIWRHDEHGELHSERVGDRWDDYHILPEASARFYMACVAEALGHLHSRMICHRDLKPENVVMDLDGYCVLVDFGFAKVVQDGWTLTMACTPTYAAPEMVNKKGHNWSVDLWALGVMIYEMLVGQTPFDLCHEDYGSSGVEYRAALFRNIQYGELCFPDAKQDGIEVSADAQDLITKLLDRDKKRRLEFGEKMMQDHPWFDGLLQGTKLRDKKVKAPWVPENTREEDTSNFESMEAEEAVVKEYGKGLHGKNFDDSLFADF